MKRLLVASTSWSKEEQNKITKMKLVFVLAAVTLAQSAKLERVYLPPYAYSSGGSSKFLQTPSYTSGLTQNVNAYTGAIVSNAQKAHVAFETRPERGQAAKERNAAVLRQDISNDVDTYSLAYETDNGITAQESGVATNGVQAQGGYTYTGDDGKVYSVKYTAGENGYVAEGNHLPTSPPIPEEILKALEENARDEAAGIFDDGTYKEEKYSATTQQQYYKSVAQRINNNIQSVAVQKTYITPSTQRISKWNGY